MQSEIGTQPCQPPRRMFLRRNSWYIADRASGPWWLTNTNSLSLSKRWNMAPGSQTSRGKWDSTPDIVRCIFVGSKAWITQTDLQLIIAKFLGTEITVHETERRFPPVHLYIIAGHGSEKEEEERCRPYAPRCACPRSAVYLLTAEEGRKATL